MGKRHLEQRVRLLLILFVAGLALSGLTAFPLVWEVQRLHEFLGPGTPLGQLWPPLTRWIDTVERGLLAANRDYPFIFYGTDWPSPT